MRSTDSFAWLSGGQLSTVSNLTALDANQSRHASTIDSSGSTPTTCSGRKSRSSVRVMRPHPEPKSITEHCAGGRPPVAARASRA